MENVINWSKLVGTNCQLDSKRCLSQYRRIFCFPLKSRWNTFSFQCARKAASKLDSNPNKYNSTVNTSGGLPYIQASIKYHCCSNPIQITARYTFPLRTITCHMKSRFKFQFRFILFTLSFNTHWTFQLHSISLNLQIILKMEICSILFYLQSFNRLQLSPITLYVPSCLLTFFTVASSIVLDQFTF